MSAYYDGRIKDLEKRISELEQKKIKSGQVIVH